MGEVYFFGCLGRSGHFLHRAGHWPTLDHHEAQRMRVPSDSALDGGAIFLPFPEQKGNGALTYLPANDLTVLAWWGSPWDERGAVNSTIMVRGRHDADAVWQAFEKSFPEFAPKMPRPTITASPDRRIDHG